MDQTLEDEVRTTVRTAAEAQLSQKTRTALWHIYEYRISYLYLQLFHAENILEFIHDWIKINRIMYTQQHKANGLEFNASWFFLPTTIQYEHWYSSDGDSPLVFFKQRTDMDVWMYGWINGAWMRSSGYFRYSTSNLTKVIFVNFKFGA